MDNYNTSYLDSLLEEASSSERFKKKAMSAGKKVAGKLTKARDVTKDYIKKVGVTKDEVRDFASSAGAKINKILARSKDIEGKLNEKIDNVSTEAQRKTLLKSTIKWKYYYQKEVAIIRKLKPVLKHTYGAKYEEALRKWSHMVEEHNKAITKLKRMNFANESTALAAILEEANHKLTLLEEKGKVVANSSEKKPLEEELKKELEGVKTERAKKLLLTKWFKKKNWYRGQILRTASGNNNISDKVQAKGDSVKKLVDGWKGYEMLYDRYVKKLEKKRPSN